MLTVLLFLAKMLGIVLLLVLLLFVTVLLLILFAPVRYRIQAERKAEELTAYVRMTYLNPVFRFTAVYPSSEQGYAFRFLGIVIYPRKPKKKKAVSGRKQKEIRTVPDEVPKAQSMVEKTSDEGGVHEAAKTGEAPKPPEAVKAGEAPEVVEMVSYYWELFKENKMRILEVIDIVLAAGKAALPKKSRVELAFGTGQPDTTGYLYAVFCSISGYLPEDITVVPVWTEACLEGTCSFEGKVRLIHLLTTWVKIKNNQEVRFLYNKIRSMEYGGKEQYNGDC